RMRRMGLVFSSVVGFGPDEVFAWHARPGAVTRLTPPWQPVRVRHEAGSLRNGSAVLSLPGGLSWVATHRPEGYDPPRRFGGERLVVAPHSRIHRRIPGWDAGDGHGRDSRSRRVVACDVRLPASSARRGPRFTCPRTSVAGSAAHGGDDRFGRLHRIRVGGVP